jgi:hypothetical protein
MFKKSRTTIANGLKLTQVGYEHTPVEPPENKYEEDYGDEHTHTYHLHDGDNHIATIVHKTTDGGFPTSIMYHQHENGRQTLTNYGAPRYTNIDAYTSRFKWSPRHENQDMHKTNMELVKHAVNAFVTSKTGSKWAFGTKYKLPPESKTESILMNKVLDVLNEVDLAKSFKRGASGWDTTFPRFNDMNDVSKGTNHGRPPEVARNTRTKSDEFLHSIHKRTGLNPDSPAGLQQRVARNELERRRKSGKLDPKYHIKQDNIETKRVFPER